MVLRESDPAVIGGYPIEDRLGSGGMGVVYLARAASGRPLAVKVVHGQYADDQEFRARFRREVAAARRVSGAFTAPVVDADADAANPWMATVYIPGENLGGHVRRAGPLPKDRLRELAAGLAEALRDIHRVGVVHRDLKPANVMLADDGPRVIDFGVSRAAEALGADALTQTGRVMGTPPYMSPEQLTNPRDVGPASDVFSLGAVLAYAATGRGPFDSDSPYETATRVVDAEPELAEVPGELRPLLAQCLAKHPKARPTPDEFLALLQGEPVPPRPEPDPTGARPGSGAPAPRPRRRRLLVTASVGGLLLAVLGAGLAVRLAGDEPPAAAELPAGWRAWQAKDTSREGDEASGPFANCAAVRAGLLCAGDEVKAVRFSLATGKEEWSHPADPVRDDFGNSDGEILGSRADRIFVYANDETVKGKGADEEATSHYAIQALDARTGDTLWSEPVQRGQYASAPEPGPDMSTVAVTDEGVLTTYGADASSYALLRPEDGEPRWRRPFGKGADCALREAAGKGYLVCQSEKSGTRVSRLATATGKPVWTAALPGTLSLLGQAEGRLLFVDSSGAGYRKLVTYEPRNDRVRTVTLARPLGSGSTVALSRGTLYFAQSSGGIHAVDPRTGRQAWSRNSSVEFPGRPLASATHVYVASPSGRLAALDRDTGEVSWTRAGRGGASAGPADTGAPLTLVGDALYIPYGVRSVYTVDVRHP
ncbi:serine/threonine-protein kinase [Streptomyces sp. NPDC087300]|uniref:serine/threonine-protein kinase n=1 Tax=Streptomyces sp. NPDC087300 TaxID=3365780 RepID=UPI003803FC7B